MLSATPSCNYWQRRTARARTSGSCSSLPSLRGLRPLLLSLPGLGPVPIIWMLTSSSDASPNNETIQAFAKDVRRRREEPPGTYDGFIDLAASAAVRVLVHGPNSPDEYVLTCSLSLMRDGPNAYS